MVFRVRKLGEVIELDGGLRVGSGGPGKSRAVASASNGGGTSARLNVTRDAQTAALEPEGVVTK